MNFQSLKEMSFYTEQRSSFRREIYGSQIMMINGERVTNIKLSWRDLERRYKLRPLYSASEAKHRNEWAQRATFSHK